MHWMWFAVVAALCVHCCRGLVPSMSGQWAVGIRGEGSSQELEQRAQNVAKEHGLLFKGQVKYNKNSFVVFVLNVISLALGGRSAGCI